MADMNRDDSQSLLVEAIESEDAAKREFLAAVYSGESADELKQSHFTEYCKERYGMPLRKESFYR